MKTLVLADAQEQPDFARQRAFAYEPKAAERRAAQVHVRPDRELGRFLRCEQYNSFGGLRGGLHGALDLEWLAALKLRCLKTWVSIDDPARYDRYLGSAGEVTDEIMLNVGGHAAVQSGVCTLNAFATQLTDALLAFKRRHPKCVWVECLNEFRAADRSWTNPKRYDEYFTFYRIFREAIDHVNKVLRPQRPLLLGGPVTTSLYEGWLQEWIDRCIGADVAIDFISYHQYLFGPARGRPARVAYERDAVRGMLGRRELDTNLPIFVTETGVFPGGPFQMTDDFDADLLTQAAALLSGSRYYMDSAGSELRGTPVPFQWITRHDEHPWKDQLVRSMDGVPTPYGHAIGFLSRLAETRIAAESTALDAAGTGLHAIGTRSGPRVAVLVWNYQWVDGRTSFDTAVRLPRSSHIRTAWASRVGREASNYRMLGVDAASPTREELCPRFAEDAICLDVHLEPNEIALIELELESAGG